MQLQPVILSGGSGTRLWPLSRQAHPKQFLSLLGDESLLQATARRVVGLGGGIEVLAPLVVCN
jgi:mannose-1-phosphate guanylyltransferase/mannose-6-phosphate isomerase